MYSLTREVSALTAVRINRFCRFLRKGEGDGGREGGKNQTRTTNNTMPLPEVSEQRILIQHNLLQQLDQLVWQVGSHEGLHSLRHILGILSLGESCLDHLINQLTSVRILLVQNYAPQVVVTTSDQIASLALE